MFCRHERLFAALAMFAFFMLIVLIAVGAHGSTKATITKASLPAKTHTVVLTWGDNNSGATYNVYRGSAAGTEASTPIATGLTAMTFTDAQVVAGGSYFYYVTAVNAQGDESKPSNEASAILAAPPSAPFGLTAVQH